MNDFFNKPYIYFFIFYVLLNIGCSSFEMLDMTSDSENEQENDNTTCYYSYNCNDNLGVKTKGYSFSLSGKRFFLPSISLGKRVEKITDFFNKGKLSSEKGSYFLCDSSVRHQYIYGLLPSCEFIALSSAFFKEFLSVDIDNYLPSDIIHLIYKFYSWKCSCGCLNDLGVCYRCGQFSSYNFSYPLDNNKKYKIVRGLKKTLFEILSGIFNIDYGSFAVGLDRGTIIIYKLISNSSEPSFIEKKLEGHNSAVTYVSPVGFGLIVSVSEDGQVKFWRFDSDSQSYFSVGEPFGDSSLSSSAFSVLAHGVFAYGTTVGGLVKIFYVDKDANCSIANIFYAHRSSVSILKPMNNNCFVSASSYSGEIRFWQASNKGALSYSCVDDISEKKVLSVLFMKDDLFCISCIGIKVFKKKEDLKYVSNGFLDRYIRWCVHANTRIASDAFLCASDDFTVRIWKKNTENIVCDNSTNNDGDNFDYTCVNVLGEHPRPVLDVITLTDSMFVSASWDGTINIWD